MIIISPGKLILSGEHAVVYGAPACALAVNKTIQGEYEQRHDDIIAIRHDDFGIDAHLSLTEIIALHKTLQQRYEDFKQNIINIKQVLQNPIELCWFAIAQSQPHTGCNIHLRSDIPLGCGMGSSAALIVNLTLGMNALFDLKLSPEKIFELSLLAENLQHGYSSGLDIKLSLMGGLHIFRKHQPLQSIQAGSLPFHYFNSGKPESSTGECVTFVKQQNFPLTLWQKFEKTTLAFVDALKNKNQKNLITLIKNNHRLLCEIGVVPRHIQTIIADIESQGGAAKICGAGSIRGKNAGVILMMNHTNWPDTSTLTDSHCGAFRQ